MRPSHQLPSPPPSDRDDPVSSTHRPISKMPIDYAIETEVKPIVRDFRTGTLIDPGGAGDKFVVDRHGKRVPYEILPDGTPSPTPKRRRIKVECAAYDLPQSPDIKSEDEEYDGSRTLAAESHNISRDRPAPSRQLASQAIASPRARTPCTSPHGRDRKSRVRKSPSDDDSSDGAGPSSSEDDSSEEDSSSDESDSSDETSSSSEADSSVRDQSSVYRPSRSPSRFVDTAFATTRSRSQVKSEKDSASCGPSTPSHVSKTKPTPQVTSVPRPPSLSFYIPIRQTDCQSRPSSRLPSHRPAPVRAQSIVSPASSRAHGWNPINKHEKKAKATKSFQHADRLPDPSDVQHIPTAPAAMLASMQHMAPTTRHYRSATAGPSTRPHGPAHYQSPFIHSPQKSSGAHVAQPSSLFQGSPKGKGKAIATSGDIARQGNDERARNHFPADASKSHPHGQDEDKRKSNDYHDHKRLSKKKSHWQKLRAKKKARKQAISLQAGFPPR